MIFPHSAYHGTPVHIDVLKCVMLDSNTFHREVNLMIGDRVRDLTHYNNNNHNNNNNHHLIISYLYSLSLSIIYIYRN